MMMILLMMMMRLKSSSLSLKKSSLNHPKHFVFVEFVLLKKLLKRRLLFAS